MCYLVEVTENSVTLADGSTLPCGLVVWSTGLAPRPFTQKLTLSKNDRGQLLTDEWLQVCAEKHKLILFYFIFYLSRRYPALY